MPKTHRLLLKRQLAHSYTAIENSIGHIARVGLEFDAVHPELAEYLKYATEGLMGVQAILNEFAAKAWGNDDPDWVSWSNKPNELTVIDE
jgi:hypothetical protein